MGVGVTGNLPWAGRCPVGIGTAGVGVLIVVGVIAFGALNRGLDSQVAAAPTGRLSDSLRWCWGPQSFYFGYLINILSCFISCIGTDGSHSGMGRSDVVLPLRFSHLGSVVSRRGK